MGDSCKHLIFSFRYGDIPDLLFNDDLVSLAEVEDRDQLYTSVLGKSYGSSLITPAENINEIRRCPIPSIRMCVTSEPELAKCR